MWKARVGVLQFAESPGVGEQLSRQWCLPWGSENGKASRDGRAHK